MNSAHGECIVLTAINHEENAARFARGLVEERIAACVTRLPAGISIYRWESEDIAEEAEHVLLIKTHRSKLDRLETYFETNHPYSVPEMLFFPAEKVNGAYSKWLIEELGLS